jgi:hypothetical protein
MVTNKEQAYINEFDVYQSLTYMYKNLEMKIISKFLYLRKKQERLIESI